MTPSNAGSSDTLNATLGVAPPVAMETLPDDLETAVRNGFTVPAPRAATGPDQRIAVIVAHGMGQQVPFQTLHDVARGITERHPSVPDAKPDITARFVDCGDNWWPRLEVTLRAGGKNIIPEIHLYEVYWAPLTEGLVTLRDVALFLLDAAWRGLRSGKQDLQRWMFGAEHPMQLRPWARTLLATALVVLLLAACLFVAFCFFAVSEVISLAFVPAWRTTVTSTLAGLVVRIGFLTAAVAALGTLASAVPHRGNQGSSAGHTPQGLAGLLITSATVAVGAAALFAGSLCIWETPVLSWASSLWALATAQRAYLQPVLLVGGGWLAWFVRQKLIQYPGDVAAYVSAYSVNKFWEVRGRIQRVGRGVARDVYSAFEGKELLYDHVIVTGHSLGSVVAYDMLNDALQRDEVLRGRFGAVLDVPRRTRLFLTFGSPLDKIAFFFRTQADRKEAREVLSAATQPMIVDYKERPLQWINIWSPWDWVSGALDYYDDGSGNPRQVTNVVDRAAPPAPGRAHTGYWTREAFGRILYDACTR